MVSVFGYTIKRMIKSKSFVLLLVSYGLNVGVFQSLGALLNQIVKPTLMFGTTTDSAQVDKTISLMSAISLVSSFPDME